MEKFGSTNREVQKLDYEDLLEEHEGTSYYPLLKKLPSPLVIRHISELKTGELSEEQIYTYFSNLIEQRIDALTESLISDSHLHELYPDAKNELFKPIETKVFESPDIGYGQTAKVKRFDLERGGEKLSLAVKFLLTPTEKTLSASAEHDMLHEVERIQIIEKLEEGTETEHIKVPHPYLHHKSEKLQCYAMELVEGATLQDVLDGYINVDLHTSLKESLSHISEEVILREVEVFLKKMHEYCLHGDIKPRNIMINKDGTFYIIDFGQSILLTDISEDGMEQLQNLKEDEIKNSKTIVRMLYKKLFPK